MKYHIQVPNDIDQPAISSSDSEMSDGDHLVTDYNSLESDVNFSSEEDGEIFLLLSYDEVQLAVPSDNSSSFMLFIIIHVHYAEKINKYHFK